MHNNYIVPICPTCGKSLDHSFYNLRRGYKKHCSIKCAANDVKVKEKRVETNIEKFGVENPYQSEDIKRKIKKTLQNRYGVDAALKSPTFKKKMIETNRKRYGAD